MMTTEHTSAAAAKREVRCVVWCVVGSIHGGRRIGAAINARGALVT